MVDSRREWTPEEVAQRDFALLQLVAHADAATQRLYIRRQRAVGGAGGRVVAAAQLAEQQPAKAGRATQRQLRSAARLAGFRERKARAQRARSAWQRTTAAVTSRIKFDRMWQVHNEWYAETVNPPPPLEAAESMQIDTICTEPREGMQEHQADAHCEKANGGPSSSAVKAAGAPLRPTYAQAATLPPPLPSQADTAKMLERVLAGRHPSTAVAKADIMSHKEVMMLMQSKDKLGRAS